MKDETAVKAKMISVILFGGHTDCATTRERGRLGSGLCLE